MELDLSLENKEIYAGVKIESYGGKKSFELNQDNLNLIGENIAGYIKKAKAEAKASGGGNDKNSPAGFADLIILTGATAIPVYLTAFHAVVHSFHEVRYRNEMYEVTVAKH